MTPNRQLTQWWASLTKRWAGTALAVAGSSPGCGRHCWCAGDLAGQLVTQSTTFYAASVTKQVVAALAARAVLDGRLDTQAGIATFLSGLPAWMTSVRVHHLLHHTAGLPQPRQLAVALGYSDDARGWSQMNNQKVLIALHRVAPSQAVPGRQFSYDNTGYILLAEVLRAVHGQAIAGLAREILFEPLGLVDSRLGGPATVQLPSHVAPPATIGDGGLWTCAADLLTWLEAINEARFGPELSALVQAPGRLDDGAVLDYAWGIGPRSGPVGTMYLHGGQWPGWCAMTVRCPTTASAVVVLAAAEDMAVVSNAALELHERLIMS